MPMPGTRFLMTGTSRRTDFHSSKAQRREEKLQAVLRREESQLACRSLNAPFTPQDFQTLGAVGALRVFAVGVQHGDVPWEPDESPQRGLGSMTTAQPGLSCQSRTLGLQASTIDLRLLSLDFFR